MLLTDYLSRADRALSKLQLTQGTGNRNSSIKERWENRIIRKMFLVFLVSFFFFVYINIGFNGIFLNFVRYFNLMDMDIALLHNTTEQYYIILLLYYIKIDKILYFTS